MLLDVTRLLRRALRGERATGVDRVALAYMEHWEKRARALVRMGGLWITPDIHASSALFEALRESAPAPSLRRTLIRALPRHRAVDPESALCNPSLSGFDNPAYTHAVRQRGLHAIYCLYDLIPITHPEFCRAGSRDAWRRRLQVMAASASGLIVNTQAVRRDLVTYAADVRLALPPIEVIPLGVSALPRPAPASPLDKPYFVTIGTVEARKNHLLLLHVWRRLCDTRPMDEVPRLVIIGQRGWECEQVFDHLDRSPALREAVIELGACDDAALSTWLQHARALLFPSFAEGFGLPLIEAMAMGTPAIVSALDVFREVAGPLPEFLDPLDGPAWRSAVLDYARPDSPRRAEQLARLRGFRAPTWADHFSTVDAALRDWKLLV